jgi:hypothetical protein
MTITITILGETETLIQGLLAKYKTDLLEQLKANVAGLAENARNTADRIAARENIDITIS